MTGRRSVTRVWSLHSESVSPPRHLPNDLGRRRPFQWKAALESSCIYIDLAAILAQGETVKNAASNLSAPWRRASMHVCDGQLVPIRRASPTVFAEEEGAIVWI